MWKEALSVFLLVGCLLATIQGEEPGHQDASLNKVLLKISAAEWTKRAGSFRATPVITDRQSQVDVYVRQYIEYGCVDSLEVTYIRNATLFAHTLESLIGKVVDVDLSSVKSASSCFEATNGFHISEGPVRTTEVKSELASREVKYSKDSEAVRMFSNIWSQFSDNFGPPCTVGVEIKDHNMMKVAFNHQARVRRGLRDTYAFYLTRREKVSHWKFMANYKDKN